MTIETQAALQAAGTFGVAVLVLLFVRRALLRALERASAATATNLDDVILHAVRWPSLVWVVTVAASVTVRVAPVDAALREVVADALVVLLVLSATAVVANASGEVLERAIRGVNPEGRVPAIGRVVTRVLAWMLGGMIALRVLGIEIAPLLTALGVGGLAVALAMQETLGNLFAGIHILVEQPFRVGDFIRLEDGQSGYVHDISWRTTRVRTLDDDFVIVPNSKLAGSQLVNHYLLRRRTRLQVDVPFELDADAERVTVALRAALEDARDAGEVLAEPAFDVLLQRVGPYALEFRLRFFVHDVVDQPRVLDVVNRAIVARARAAGLTFALPAQRLWVDER